MCLTRICQTANFKVAEVLKMPRMVLAFINLGDQFRMKGHQSRLNIKFCVPAKFSAVKRREKMYCKLIVKVLARIIFTSKCGCSANIFLIWMYKSFMPILLLSGRFLTVRILFLCVYELIYCIHLVAYSLVRLSKSNQVSDVLR